MKRKPPRAIDAGDDVCVVARETIEAIDDDAGPVDTGLLDADGRPIIRPSHRKPLGFMR